MNFQKHGFPEPKIPLQPNDFCMNSGFLVLDAGNVVTGVIELSQ